MAGADGGTLFEAALRFAIDAHGHQQRKGSAVPYITHPVAVAAILAQYGFAKEVVVGGLLHDVVEDAGVPLAELARRFGERVAALVDAVTERKHDGPAGAPARPWEIRKAELLERLDAAPVEAVAVKAADTLHNVLSISRDLRVAGPEVWRRFRRGRDEQLRNFDAIISLVRRRLVGPAGDPHPLANELEEAIERLRGQSL